MNIFHSIANFKTEKKTILTLGTYDGVHLGHRKILERITQNALEQDCQSVVLTFFPHPRMVLQGENTVKLLNTIEEKTALLQEAGIQNLVIHPFDESFSKLTAEEFVKNLLVEKLKIQKIIIGYDHRFGRNRTADINDLILFGKQYNFEVEQILAEEINAVSISSTKVRNALDEGNVALANTFLGYAYFLNGTIVKGKQLGRTIGFPTANFHVEEAYKLIPKNGVYVVMSIINNQKVYGMMNIGFKPTVDGENLSIEVHYFDFEGDLYGQKLSVHLLEYLREEQKFESVTHLQQQLESDKKSALSFINIQQA